MIDFFISYAREDRTLAREIIEVLSGYGWSTWIDEKDIPPSVPWMTEIQRAINDSMIVLTLESETWQGSEACQIELDIARQGNVPVLHVPAGAPDATQIATAAISAYQQLPPWRTTALQAAEAAAIWGASGKRRSVLARGSRLRQMRRDLVRHAEDFSPPAAAFIAASRQAAIRRRIIGAIAGLVTPILVLGMFITISISRKVDEATRQSVAQATAFAERSTYAAWNYYSGLERIPVGDTVSFTEYSELFHMVSERTPSAWEPAAAESARASDAGSNTSPDGSLRAARDDASVVVRARNGSIRKLRAADTVNDFAWSPDSRWIAVATQSGAEVLSAKTGMSIPLRGGAGAALTIRWLDDRRVSASGSEGTGAWQVFDAEPLAQVSSVRYGARIGNRMFTIDEGGRVTAVDLESGSSEVIVDGTLSESQPSFLAASGTELIVAFYGADPFLRVIDVDTRDVREIAVPQCAALGLSVSSDGASAYLACDDPRVNRTRVDLRTGEITSRPMESQPAWGVRALDDRVLWGGVYGAVFETTLDLDPEGLLTANAGCGAPIRQLVGPSNGRSLFQIGDGTGSFSCATRLALDRGSVDVDRLIFDASDGYAVPSAAVSPDGSLVAYGLSDGQVRVFTTDDLVPVYFGRIMPGEIRSVAFSADGSDLILVGDDGVIEAMPVSSTSMEEAAAEFVAEARTRLDNALEWGIYASTVG